jgi:hypothetical protein
MYWKLFSSKCTYFRKDWYWVQTQKCLTLLPSCAPVRNYCQLYETFIRIEWRTLVIYLYYMHEDLIHVFLLIWMLGVIRSHVLPMKMPFFYFLGVRWDWVHLVRRQLIGLLYQPRIIDEDECEAVGGTRIGSGNRSTRGKLAPVPLCPPQIPHDLTSGLEPGPPRWGAGHMKIGIRAAIAEAKDRITYQDT